MEILSILLYKQKYKCNHTRCIYIDQSHFPPCSIPWLLEHEEKQGLAWRKGPVPSGTSAVYDLQTALHFMVAFLSGISDACRNGHHWDAAARMKAYDVSCSMHEKLRQQLYRASKWVNWGSMISFSRRYFLIFPCSQLSICLQCKVQNQSAHA